MTVPGLLCLDTMTLKRTPLSEQLGSTREARLRGVRIRGNDVKAFVSDSPGPTAADVGRLARQAGLAPPGFVTVAEVYDWHFRSPDEPDLSAALEATFETARLLGSELAVLPVMHAQGDLDMTVRNFGVVCDRAREHGLSIGLECIG